MNLIALVSGMLAGIAVWLLMSPQLGRWLYGLILFSSTINLVIFLAGRSDFAQPAFIEGAELSNLSNPLPQAMILTAIVIAFAVIAFSLVILRSLYQKDRHLLDKHPYEKPRVFKGGLHHD
ncbi:MAG: NADH-quinone oxidoreductase subunit K [Legionellaceae bacterium]|nr:NADH-quinone oxidoreductase subunit K [Legionellaceae bacterium]